VRRLPGMRPIWASAEIVLGPPRAPAGQQSVAVPDVERGRLKVRPTGLATSVGRLCTMLMAVALAGGLAAAEPEALAVRLERVEGEPLEGRLVAIDAEEIRIESAAGVETLPLAGIRTLVREAVGPPPPAAVLVETTDGGRLSGSDFRQDDQRGILTVTEGEVDLPIERIRRVAWLSAGETEPDWLDDLPERPASDLVTVRRGEGHAFVECAVVGVSPDSVTVVLDGERIPVKRAKVLGIEWLRETREPGGVQVVVAGGRLGVAGVRWSPAGLVLDDSLRLPAGSLRSIDYAAGRTTPLVDLTPEQSSFEPFFGALAKEPGLAAFFAPRTVGDLGGEGRRVLVVRPRTEITWRVPADSRRFRGTLERDVPAQAAAAVELVLAIDGAEAWRRRLGGPAADGEEPVPFDLEVTGGRRLTLRVEFVPGDIGCGVRLAGGAFEK
jgi:hypothetical protein